MLLGDPPQSDQRTQSFFFPIVIHQSLDPAAQSSARAPSSLSFYYLRALRSSSTRQAQIQSQNASTPTCWVDAPSQDVYGTCSRMIGVLRRLRRRLQGTTVKAIFIGAIRPRMEYASQVWSGGPTQSLQRLQDSFCKRHGIRLPPLQTRFDYHSLVLLYKMRSSLVPPYLCTLLPRQVSATTGYSLRKSGYPVPATRKSSTLASFLPRSIVLWNALPKEIQESNTLTKFKTRLRTHLHI